MLLVLRNDSFPFMRSYNSRLDGDHLKALRGQISKGVATIHRPIYQFGPLFLQGVVTCITSAHKTGAY